MLAGFGRVTGKKERLESSVLFAVLIVTRWVGICRMGKLARWCALVRS